MSSTIIRVKRRLEDNPQEALLVLSKRKKTDTNDLASSLFVFRGTAKNQESEEIKNVIHKNDIKSLPCKSVNDIVHKLRADRKEQSLGNRYKIVSRCRGLEENNDKGDNEDFDLVDLQTKESENVQTEFAYDLYTSIKPDFDSSLLDNLVSIENYETDLIFGSHLDNGRRTPSTDANDDDDDSNDENNWRHDYPDTEDSSINDDDMARAAEQRDDNLSSDDDEDRIYDGPSNPFNSDVRNYGEAYARYKAKILGEERGNSDDCIHVIDEFEDMALERYDSDD